MNFKNLFFCIVVMILTFVNSNAQEVLQWRGIDRKGVYNEKGLLKVWPESGPNLLWEYDDLGNGYGSPAITSKNIFILGETDSVTYLFAFELSGKLLWKSKVGKEWTLNYPGSHTTPTVVGDLVYVTTGFGSLACFETMNGNLKWSLDLLKDFHGRLPRFGYSESALVDGDNVFYSPGGKDTNTVSLNRFTGKINWICKGMSEEPAYCSPLLITLLQRKILVTFSMHSLLGIDTKDGKLLWSHKQVGEGDVHVNTPLFEDGYIYYIAGNGNGSVKLKLSDDGTSITEVWKNASCDNIMGAFIKVGNYIYSSGYEIRNYKTLDATTGQVVDSTKFDRGTINYADGLLYLYNEKGQVGLFKPNGPKMDLISTFKITKGTKAHYAHPVINKGILYIRRGNSLMAYNIKA